jgi:phage shock protein C
MERKLYRSQNNRIFLGVCGGLGEYFSIDPTIVRVLAVLITIFTWIVPGLIAYLIMALIAPLQGSPAGNPQDTLHENITDIKDSASKLGENIRSTLGVKDKDQPPVNGKNSPAGTPSVNPPASARQSSNKALYLLGIIVIAIGAFLILVNFLDWFWTKLWPLWMVAAGVIIIIVVATRKK